MSLPLSRSFRNTLLFIIISSATSIPSWAQTDQPADKFGPLAVTVTRIMEETPEYSTLRALYMDHRQKEGEVWEGSTRARRILAILDSLHVAAISASTIDPKDPQGERVVNMTWQNGNTIRFDMDAGSVDSDEAVRMESAATVCRFILDMEFPDGLYLLDLAPSQQEAVNATMNKGYVAAKQKDYLSAILNFEEARKIAPDDADIDYNLGLAESRIPGREFRAMAWYGAYLAADPDSSRALIIKEQIRQLRERALSRFIALVEKIANQGMDAHSRYFDLVNVADLWARAGNDAAAFKTVDNIQEDEYSSKSSAKEKVAQAQLKRGDFAAALRTLELIGDATTKDSLLRSIAEAQAKAGDVKLALHTVDAIHDLFTKSTAKNWVAREQTKAGDLAGALQTLADGVVIADGMPDSTEPNFKAIAKQYLSLGLARAGDIEAALRTADSIQGSPFQASLAKQEIAEAQSQARDVEGARQTLAVALAIIDDIPDKGIIMGSYNEVKARIDNGTAGSTWDVAEESALSTLPKDWAALNEGLLNTPVVMDLKGYLGTLPTDDPGNIFQALLDTCRKMVEINDTIGKMFKEMEKQHGA